MATSGNDRQPMEQPGTRQRGSDVGGISRNAEGGLEDAMDRMAERRDDDASGAAATGQGGAGSVEPRLDRGGHNEPGDAPASPRPSDEPGTQGASPRPRTAADEGAVATPPAGATPPEPSVPPDQQMTSGSGADEPPDEGPLESLGRAISEAIIGTLDEGAPRDAPHEPPDEKR